MRKLKILLLSAIFLTWSSQGFSKKLCDCQTLVQDSYGNSLIFYVTFESTDNSCLPTNGYTNAHGLLLTPWGVLVHEGVPTPSAVNSACGVGES